MGEPPHPRRERRIKRGSQVAGCTCKGGCGLAALGVYWKQEIQEREVSSGMGVSENPVDPEGQAQEKQPARLIGQSGGGGAKPPP